MPFTHTIVSYINSHLENNGLNKSLFQPARYFNIATSVPHVDDPSALFPGVIDEYGEIENIQPDDIYNLSIYHKIIGNGYSTQKKGSYGDEYDIVSQTEMQMFVFAQSDKIKMPAESLEPHIVFGIPAGISRSLGDDLSIKSCSITVVSSDMDKVRNFKNEFQGVKYFLAPEHIFFSVRYSIRKTFDRNCVDACTCSN